MEKYDVAVVGASTTGSWFAHKMASQGFKVLLIEKASENDISRSYDIFHMARKEMEKFQMIIPKEGEKEFAFEFTGGSALSAYGNYPKPSFTQVVGMHKHDYILRMGKQAEDAGATLIYNAPFKDFLFNDDGKIIGLKYTTSKGEQEALASIVADCSGIPSAARTKLPDGYGTENFVISPRDMMYVIINYVKYPEGHEKIAHTDSFLQYKCWSAPSDDENGGILGVGANLSFDYAQEMFNEFRKHVPWSDYKIEKTEYGITPYHRPPYTLVCDGFIALGDAACMTKPNNGEGCTSSLYEAEIAVEVIGDALREGGYLTTERLWSINKRYIDVQGKMFAAMQAVLIGAACINPEETEYLFKHDVIFSKKIFAGLADGFSITPVEIANYARVLTQGVTTGVIRPKLLKSVINALTNGAKLLVHYGKFPETTEGFDDWCKKADAIWDSVGSMADNCDEEIVARIEGKTNIELKKQTV